MMQSASLGRRFNVRQRADRSGGTQLECQVQATERTTSLTLSCMTIALQDGPAPTSGAENGQHGPSWLTVLVVNPVSLA